MAKVLVVEDELGLAASLAAGLREERYIVDLASDGEEAELLAEINEYDLIILDVLLPKKNGFYERDSLLNIATSTRADLLLSLSDFVGEKMP
ncbi:MAG: DNA-binding response regulator [Acidobacteria bacterium]|nr:MAG: DNA-binding response regulator [Acidobacteriota bacterium]